MCHYGANNKNLAEDVIFSTLFKSKSKKFRSELNFQSLWFAAGIFRKIAPIIQVKAVLLKKISVQLLDEAWVNITYLVQTGMLWRLLFYLLPSIPEGGDSEFESIEWYKCCGSWQTEPAL